MTDITELWSSPESAPLPVAPRLPFAGLQPTLPASHVPNILTDPNALPQDRIAQGLAQGGVRVIAPDGTKGWVHSSGIDAFLKKNPDYQRAAIVTAPDGHPGTVPFSQAGDFLKANPDYKLGQPTPSAQAPTYGSDQWYASKVPQPFVGALNRITNQRNRMAQFGAEYGKEALTAPVRALTSLQHPPPAADISAPIFDQQRPPVRTEADVQALAEKEHPAASGILGGIGETAGGIAGDPAMWPLLFSGGALPVVQRLVGAGFSAQMLHDAYQQYPEIKAAADRGDEEAVYRGLTHLGLNLYMGAKGAESAVRGTVPAVQRNLPAVQESAGNVGQALVQSSPVQRVRGWIKPAEALTPAEAITRAAVPKGKAKATWRDAVASRPQTLADARRGADTLGINVDTMTVPDAVDAVRQAKKDIWQENAINHPTEGGSADTSQIADRIRSTISQRSAEGQSGWVKEALARADTYDNRDMPLGEIEDRVAELNNKTRGIEAMFPSDKTAAKLQPENKPIFAERDALRELLLQRLDEMSGPGARELRKRYGNLSVLEGALSRRVEDLASKATDESELWKLARIRSAGRVIRGLSTAGASVASGQPLGAALGIGDVYSGMKQLQAQRMADLKRNPEWLVRKAFRETTPAPQANLTGPPRPPIAGLLPSPPIPMGPAPEAPYTPPQPPPFDYTTRAQRLGLLLPSPPIELGGEVQPPNVPPVLQRIQPAPAEQPPTPPEVSRGQPKQPTRTVKAQTAPVPRASEPVANLAGQEVRPEGQQPAAQEQVALPRTAIPKSPAASQTIPESAATPPSFKRANPPQVAQPLIKGDVTFQTRNGNGEVLTLKGKEYYLPGFEEYRIAITKPRGSIANHNKTGWEAYEVTTGRRIYGDPHQTSTEQGTINGALRVLQGQGKANIDKAISGITAAETKPAEPVALPKTAIPKAPSLKSDWQTLYEQAKTKFPERDSELRKMSGEQLKAEIAKPTEEEFSPIRVGGTKESTLKTLSTRAGIQGAEPWQMTRQQWESARDDLRPSWHALEKAGGATPKGVAQANREVSRDARLRWLLGGAKNEEVIDGELYQYPVTHKDVVKKALAEGLPVPAEVLKDYPELQAQKEKPSATPAETPPAGAQTGKPFEAILYRGEGTPSAEAAKNRIPAQFAEGEYWSPDQDVAASYGPKVRSEKVQLKNPYVLNIDTKKPYYETLRKEFGTLDTRKITDQLKAQGHDGLIVNNVLVMREGVPLKNTQEIIKFRPPAGAQPVVAAKGAQEQVGGVEKTDLARGSSATEAAQGKVPQQALDDWNSNRAYWDGHNFRYSRKESKGGAPESRGKITPWNKQAKAAGGLQTLNREWQSLYQEAQKLVPDYGVDLAKLNRQQLRGIVERNRARAATEPQSPPVPTQPAPARREVAPEGKPNVISEFHSRDPERTAAVNRWLNMASEKGKPAIAVGEELYTPGAKYRLATDDRGRVTLQKEHDLSQIGFENALERTANLTGEPDKWASYNSAAKKLGEKIVADRKAKYEAQAAEEEKQRVAREEEYRQSQESRAKIEQDLASSTFKQATAKLPMSSGETREVKGPSIGGLIVHKNGLEQKFGAGYDISHIASGLRVNPKSYGSQSEAKVAAMRLAKLGDWNRSADALNTDKQLQAKARGLMVAMDKDGIYVPDEKATPIEQPAPKPKSK